MIITRSVIDQIEIRPQENVVQLRIAKQIVDGDTVVHSEWHRTMFEPNTDVESHMQAVNDHLAAMGCGRVEDIQPIRDHVALARKKK